MNDTQITLTGWLGTEVSMRTAGGAQVAGFRLATTPRRYDRKTERWVDGDTQWYSVSAWRQLAKNCAASLRMGDPVVLHGRLTARAWTGKDGEQNLTQEVEATFIGHDLTMGVTRFVRNPKVDASAVDEAAVEPEPEFEPGEPHDAVQPGAAA